ncbi:16S rRNA (uracil(1498)-N(3))-methyltransferase [bacterium]|nr:16S rRNA (uracil(1498)-N(3))-methyltransferase [bacterium]MBU0899709.1 16S rRNA (uracil(1498)-N(3))-methyltransferase [bacterium]MBU1153414.1 16S rRNA (uracil(1498)-N(3))-methyltransferase [bacterium]MBU1781864.1 16S rRNA (uracil(1498)-N(3))-methyltransferase [bacterium]MBU2599244.1 16S rRNA (uracil(1498)-N(3))-methyltransferase [bacterium]
MNHKRLFISEIKDHNFEITSPEQVHYLKNVLRLKKKEEIIILDGKGWEYKTEVERINTNKIKVVSKEEIFHPLENYSLILYQSLLKSPKMDFLVQKTSELNVSKFVPIVTTRSLRYLSKEVVKNKVAHWQKIAMSSASQSKRVRLMEIAEPIWLKKDFLKKETFGKAVVFWEEEQKNLREELLFLKDPKSISLFVGPEGGLTKEEIDLLRSQGVVSVSLGNQILRSETAAVVVVAIILYQWGII